MYNTQFEHWNEVFQTGKVLLIDKPLHWTSFDAVKKIRTATGIRKVGHAGTLDPLATGLLIICTGKYTKKIQSYMAEEKEYTGSFTLGATTPTYDLESAPVFYADYHGLTADQIHEATKQFTGSILQIPPAHSAIKKSGIPSYILARKGKEVKMDPRPVSIAVFEITGIELPTLYFRVICSTGTYIRSLANDFGMFLGCGAHLSALRRTRIGAFEVNQAQTIDAFVEEVNQLKQAKF